LNFKPSVIKIRDSKGNYVKSPEKPLRVDKLKHTIQVGVEG